jgi:hypothetical protein
MNETISEQIDQTRDVLRDSIFALMEQYFKAGLIEITKTDIYTWQISNDTSRLTCLIEEVSAKLIREMGVH